MQCEEARVCSRDRATCSLVYSLPTQSCGLVYSLQTQSCETKGVEQHGNEALVVLATDAGGRAVEWQQMKQKSQRNLQGFSRFWCHGLLCRQYYGTTSSKPYVLTVKHTGLMLLYRLQF